MFVCTIQLAGYDFDRSDDAGPVELDPFLKMLGDFPWAQQLEKYAQEQKGSSPTISVTEVADDRTLWVSVMGRKDQPQFLIGYVYPKKIKKFLGLGKEESKKWVDIFIVTGLADTREFFRLFFLKDYEALKTSLGLEKPFDSMPAKK